MRKLTGRSGRRQGDETTQPPTRPAPWIARRFSTEFGRRHVKGVTITRLLVAIAAVTLGSIFCASGYWWGALLFVPAALNLWFAYLMPSWKRALDAENAHI
jgi:fatty acid desaturase